jgi:primosomal protein N' (replication factor Y)
LITPCIPNEPTLVVLKIALGYPLPLFDYLAPPDIDIDAIKIGMRIEVPFGKKQVIGIIVAKGLSNLKADKLKHALNLPDPFPLFSEEMIAWFKGAADYYHYPIGEVIFTGLPVLLKKNLPLTELLSPKKRRSPKIELLDKTKLDNAELEQALILTHEQEKAVTQITENLTQFSCYLLKGITGSGKTEVYLQAIEQCSPRQVLILIPEIALAPQTCQRVINRFGEKATIYHSQLTPTQKLAAWHDVFSGQKQIVVGTRSALFLSFKNLGMIIVDEEHDQSFKQQEGFLFSARDMAIWRAKLANIPIILGSATPSLESLHNAQLKRFSPLILSKRPNDAQLPTVKIIDTNIEQLNQGLSGSLITAIKQTLLANQQVLLFINRRGYAPTVMCVQCFWQAKCPQCEGRLTYHLQYNRLSCHSCEIRQPLPIQCPTCQSTKIKPIGLGTERIESALETLFPNANIARIDSDTITTPKKLNSALEKINSGESQILIGTQLLAKGHHFPNVTLVGIIHIDSGLYSTDFRATERTAQLITQVSGRAGRATQPGTVYLQTALPQHPLLQAILLGGYDAFAEYILRERQQTHLPPFSHLAIIRAKAKSQEEVMKTLSSIKSQLNSQPELKLFGPIISQTERQNDLSHAQLWVIADKRSQLQLALTQLTHYKSHYSVKWTIDVDPLSTY